MRRSISKKKEQEQVNKYMLKGTVIGLALAMIYDISRGCLFEHTMLGVILGNFVGCLIAYKKDGNSIKGGWFLWIYFAFVLFVLINECNFIRNEQLSANIMLAFAVIVGVIAIVICVRFLLSDRKNKENKLEKRNRL